MNLIGVDETLINQSIVLKQPFKNSDLHKDVYNASDILI